MLTGSIKMDFTDKGTTVDVNISFSEGMASKCFIIDALCKALNLEGTEKITAMMICGLSGDVLEKENDKNES